MFTPERKNRLDNEFISAGLTIDVVTVTVADVSEQFDGPPQRDGRPERNKTRRTFAGLASAVIAE